MSASIRAPEVWTANKEFSGGRRPALNTPTLVLYHWDRCGHCIAFRPEWQRLPQLVQADPDWTRLANNAPSQYALRLAEIEAGEIQNVTDRYGKGFFTEPAFEGANTQDIVQHKLRGFPELRLYVPGSQAVYIYEGPRRAEDIAAWVKSVLMTGQPSQATPAAGAVSMCYSRRRGRLPSSSSHRRRRRSSSLYHPSHVVATRLAQGGNSAVRRRSRQSHTRQRHASRSRSRD